MTATDTAELALAEAARLRAEATALIAQAQKLERLARQIGSDAHDEG